MGVFTCIISEKNLNENQNISALWWELNKYSGQGHLTALEVFELRFFACF